MTFDVPRGCECICTAHGNHISTPVAYLISREGREMKVCTRCQMSNDKIISMLIDRETPSNPYIEFDALGAMLLIMRLTEDAPDRKVREDNEFAS